MDESALRISLAILELLRASLVPLLELSTRLVVVGLLVDAGVILKEYALQVRDFRSGTIHSPERPSTFLLALGLLGTFLITGGVAGELVLQSRIGTVETEMRLTSDKLVALVSKEAGSAHASAKGAADAAGRANDLALAIGKQAEGLATRLKKAQSDELEERNRVVAMEEWVAPRTIPIISGPEEPNWKVLESFTGSQFIIQGISDEETRRAQGQMIAILEKARWKPALVIGMIISASAGVAFPDGVTILPPSSSEQDAADTLADFLWSYHWDAASEKAPPRPEVTIPRSRGQGPFPGIDLAHTISIQVGFKPNPYATGQVTNNVKHTNNTMSDDRKRRRQQLRQAREREMTNPLLNIGPK